MTDFAAQAGYAPAGLRAFLETLAAFAADAANQQKTGMWNGKTHPAFSTRVAKVNDLLKKYPATGETLAERFKKNTAASSSPTPNAPAPSPMTTGLVLPVCETSVRWG